MSSKSHMTGNYIHIHLNTVDSTNTYAKSLILSDAQSDSYRSADDPDSHTLLPLLVTADQQTAGRGRMGHTFLSPAGSGIYMSYAYERSYSEEELLNVTTRVAELILPVLRRHYNPMTNSTVAAARSTFENSRNQASGIASSHTELEKFDLRIKPVNDIYIGDPADPDSRKIVGILTERVDYPKNFIIRDCTTSDSDSTLTDSAGSITAHPNYFLIVGIGIDCFPFDIPEDLKDKIGFLEPDCSMEQLTAEIADVLGQL